MARHSGVRLPRLAHTAGLALLAACGDSQKPEPVRFDTPITGVPGASVFYGAYLDHGPSQPTDYACGIKAYAGHRGVDILLRNFQVQDSGVTVVAAASGTVVSRQDGLPDRNTVNGAGGFGNHLVLAHGGDIQTIYGHLRSGSIQVSVNDRVEAGAPLGLVGSSGNSNWPHVHFEVRSGGVATDPFSGACNSSESMWQSQLAYQNAFQVLDAGLTDRQAVTFADLLERPVDVGTFRTDTTSFLYWVNLANIRAAAAQFLLRGPAGDTVFLGNTGPISTFSVLFISLRLPIAGSLDSLGTYSVEFRQQPLAGGGLVLAHSTTFELVAGAPAGPRRAPGPAAPPGGTITIWEAGGEAP